MQTESGSRSWLDHPQLDVAEPHLVAMVLQADAPFPGAPVARIVLPLPFRHELLPLWRPHHIVDGLRSVQPRLDVAAIHNQAGLVPFAGGLRGARERGVARV